MFELQQIAAEVVAHVLGGRSLDAELRGLGIAYPHVAGQDRAALQDICYGTLRFLGELDAVLDALLDRPLKDDSLRDLLRVALYQLAHTRAAPHAIVDHAVRACVTSGRSSAKGLVNAVLRNFLRKRDALLAAASLSDTGHYSHPQWWIDKLRDQHPERYGQMLDQANRRPPLTVRVNARRTSIAEYVGRAEASGMSVRALGGTAVLFERPVSVDRIPGFAEGVVSVQDASAQYAAPLLDVEAGMKVLDACAAPGGKTAHLLEHADIDLVALDNDAARLERVQANLTRLGLKANLVCGDAVDPSTWSHGQMFPRILADVPCSASGVVRRHPDIKWLRRPEDIARFAKRQREIVDALWRLLLSGGKLLYATCSVFSEENQAQVERFLERHDDARRLTLPVPHTNAQQLAGQILPDDTHDGFFYALLQKA